MSADVAMLAYFVRYPFVIFGGIGFHASFLFASWSSVSFTLMELFGMSISIMSPFFNRPMGPATAASGLMWPMHAPRVPPENRPSVMSATDSPSPAPMM